MTPAQLFHWDREAHPREPAYESAERELALHSSERCAETEVNAVAEREVPHVITTDVEYLGSRVVISVPVR